MEVFTRQREKERLAVVGEMAAGLAHEIRNPLGAIKGAAQFLDPSSDRPESRFLKIIIEEVDRLNREVTQFLDYSKPFSIEFSTVDLGKLTEQTVEMLKPAIPESIQLEFEVFSQAGLVRASAEQMHQVLINLIQNSQNALFGKEDGRIRVSVTVQNERHVREAVIAVEDNGKGIKKEHMDKLFIPFFTTSPSGTGLGLSICHKIVEAHQGRIEVMSEEGKFTRFSVIIPLVKE
jgi:two-component system sensor histidine kinase HydH